MPSPSFTPATSSYDPIQDWTITSSRDLVVHNMPNYNSFLSVTSPSRQRSTEDRWVGCATVQVVRVVRVAGANKKHCHRSSFTLSSLHNNRYLITFLSGLKTNLWVSTTNKEWGTEGSLSSSHVVVGFCNLWKLHFVVSFLTSRFIFAPQLSMFQNLFILVGATNKGHRVWRFRFLPLVVSGLQFEKKKKLPLFLPLRFPLPASLIFPNIWACNALGDGTGRGAMAFSHFCWVSASVSGSLKVGNLPLCPFMTWPGLLFF